MKLTFGQLLVVLISVGLSWQSPSARSETSASPLINSQIGSQEASVLTLLTRLRSSPTDQTFLNSLQDSYKNAAIGRERGLTSLALGAHYLESNYRLAMQYLAAAEMASVDDRDLLPIIRYHLAQAKMRAGAYKDAALMLEKLATTGLAKAWEKEILSALIECYYNTGSYEKFAATFLDYSKRYASSRRQENLVRMAAETFEKQGHLEKRTEILEEVVSAYPTTEVSRWAFRKLDELRCAKESPYTFSRHTLLLLSRNASLETGLKDFIIAASDAPMRISKTNTRKLTPRERVDFLFQARFYDEALQGAQEQADLLARSTSKDSLGEQHRLALLIGRIQLRLGHFEMAVRHLSDFIATSPGQEYTARAREAMGEAFKYSGHHLLAAEQFGLAAAVRNTDFLRWEQFWNTYRGGAYQQALAMLEKPGFVVPQDQDEAETLIYWRARILEHLGRAIEAQPFYSSLLQSDGQGFYASLIASAQPNLAESDNGPQRAQLVNTQRETTSEPGFRLAAKILQEDITADAGTEQERSELRLVDDLIKVGMKDSAQLQLGALTWSDYKEEDAFAAVSRLAWLLDDYQPTRRLKSRNFSALKSTPSGWRELLKHQKTHADEWKVYYPLAFKNIVDSVTSKVQVSRYLLLSVMRAESFYNKDARSGVGARGLMQIMPYTALRVARLLGDQDFDVASLSEPEVSISYGGYYLKKLLHYYDNNPFVAVAAYNAGPDAVNRWLQSCSTCSTDEFVETIPFKETRRYVRKVMRNYAQYMRIYENKDILPKAPALPGKLPLDVEIF